MGFDVEGVNLGRFGSVELVQVSTPNICCIFDMRSTEDRDDIVAGLKQILENPDIVKIVHDCRTDSDALKHHFGIVLKNVHDTQACQMILFPTQGRLNLNKTLALFRCVVNDSRDTDVYKKNPSFWAQRPMSTQMLEWASADVKTLFTLYQKQKHMTHSTQQAMVESESTKNTWIRRDAYAYPITMPEDKVGRFIGASGVHLIRRQNELGVEFHKSGTNSFVVFGASEEEVKAAILTLPDYVYA